MKRFLPVTRRDWDRAFLGVIAMMAIASAVGLLFGGPMDNLIVVVWTLPLWLLVRMRASNTAQISSVTETQ